VVVLVSRAPTPTVAPEPMSVTTETLAVNPAVALPKIVIDPVAAAADAEECQQPGYSHCGYQRVRNPQSHQRIIPSGGDGRISKPRAWVPLPPSRLSRPVEK
jgi:hypothetical protein